MNMNRYFRSHTCEICGQFVGNHGPSHANCSIEKQKKYTKAIKTYHKDTRYTEKQINYFLKRYDSN